MMTDPEKYILTFGKYKGEYLGDVPRNYLEWMLETLDLRPALRGMIEDVLEDDDA